MRVRVRLPTNLFQTQSLSNSISFSVLAGCARLALAGSF